MIGSRMPQAGEMAQPNAHAFQGRTIGITGARGALGSALARCLKAAGADVVGFTHGSPPSQSAGANRWVRWSCGAEGELDHELAQLDVLVLNHGINPQGEQSIDVVNTALEINALSSWRLMQRYEQICRSHPQDQPRELWVNTSEAEIQPAISPVYEMTKRLLGQLVSMRGAVLDESGRQQLIIRKLVLGPFRSELNPIGLMNADFVAQQVVRQASWGLRLVIVTPNPITYLFMPLAELGRRLYSQGLNRPGR